MTEQNNSNDQSATPMTANSGGVLTLKDLLIPVSIVLAGVCIGAGLYFGGAPVGPVNNVAANDAPGESAQSSDNVNPITETDHVRGSRDAQVIVVEYSDFDCPYCGRYHDNMSEVMSEYQDGEVAWVYRHLPLASIHPNATGVAVASECVAELGGNDAFWSFTDGYFDATATPGADIAELIPELVVAAGVDQAAFTECFESERHVASVQEDLDNAIATGGSGTPWSILIGPTGKTYELSGALPKSSIMQMIQVTLDEA